MPTFIESISWPGRPIMTNSSLFLKQQHALQTRSIFQTMKLIFFDIPHMTNGEKKKSSGGTLITDFGPCHTIGAYLLAIHHGNPGPIPGLDSWWMKWN
jgi:hypothetical protein